MPHSPHSSAPVTSLSSGILADRTLPDKRLTDILDVIAFCQAWQLPGKVVSRWVWCQFPGKPSAEIRTALKAAGFRWNRRRSLDGNCSIWQHNCGVRTAPAHGYDPRDKYGETDLETAADAYRRAV